MPKYFLMKQIMIGIIILLQAEGKDVMQASHKYRTNVLCNFTSQNENQLQASRASFYCCNPLKYRCKVPKIFFQTSFQSVIYTLISVFPVDLKSFLPQKRGLQMKKTKGIFCPDGEGNSSLRCDVRRERALAIKPHEPLQTFLFTLFSCFILTLSPVSLCLVSCLLQH